MLAGSGSLSFARLTDGADEATAQVAAGGEFGESKLLVGPKGQVTARIARRCKPGKTYRVEMAFIDRRVSAGRRWHGVLQPRLTRRREARGCYVAVSDWWSGREPGDSARPALSRHLLPAGRSASRRMRHSSSAPGEYFLLGDNSANSDDSRSWQIPAVPERNFLGKPFLLHQPSRPSASGPSAVERWTVSRSIGDGSAGCGDDQHVATSC